MSWKQIKRLREERGDALLEMRNILKASEDEKRDLSDEENTKFDELSATAEALETRARKYEQVGALEGQQAAGDPDQRAQPGREDIDHSIDAQADPAEKRAEAFGLYLRAGIGALSDEQRSLITSSPAQIGLETRALTTAGIGVLGTREFSSELIKSLRDWTGILEAGARTINTATGNEMTMLTVDDTANEGAQKDEGVTATEVDPDFGNQTLGAYTFDSGVVLVPFEIMQDSEVNLGSEILDLASERIGVKLNKLTTTGTGAGEPQGFVTGAVVGKTAASGTAITYEELLDLLHSVTAPYRRKESAGWQFNDQTLAAIRKLKDGAGSYIFAAGGNGAPSTVLGHRYTVNTAMADIGLNAKPIAFGDWSRYRMRFVRSPFVKRLEELYATKRSVGFYIAQRADGKLVDSRAVKTLQNAAA